MATNRPSVALMINEAIATLNEKGGSSLHAIKKYITATYNVDVQKLDSHLKKALKKGVESRSLTKPTGKGASGAFKLADKQKTTKKSVARKENKEKVSAHPKEKKVAKEVNPNAARVSPKKARANKKVVQTASATKSAAKKKAAASKQELAPEAKLPEVTLPTTVVAKVAEKEEAESSPDPDGFLNMLRIDLVVEELLQHFSVRGMKILSLVSKDVLIAVRNSKVFSERIQFRICKDSILSRVLHNCFHSWKTVRFCFTIDCGLDILGNYIDYITASSTILQSLDSVQSFSIGLGYISHSRFTHYLNPKINGLLKKIIEVSKDTLEDLELNSCCTILHQIGSIEYPNLKRLDLRHVRGADDDVIEMLLKNLPPLEKLAVNVHHPSKLFSALQGRMYKLRELSFRITCHSRESSSAQAFDWNMVAEMAMLEDISINVSSSCKTSVQELEELLLRIPAKPERKISLTLFRTQEVRFIHKGISPFIKLTKLYLNTLEKIDDESLQSIIKGCSKLRNLGLEFIENVTDFGWSGVKKSPTGDRFHLGLENRGVSLTDLMDLTTLTIESCGIISLATLLDVVRFAFLTSLKFSSRVRGWKAKSPREFLLQILQQNPSLKKVYLRIDGIDDDDYPNPRSVRYSSLEQEGRRLLPQIKELLFAYPMTGEYSESDSESSDSDSD